MKVSACLWIQGTFITGDSEENFTEKGKKEKDQIENKLHEQLQEYALSLFILYLFP